MWYAKKSAGNGQGLVVDEDTGRNVAVTYDENDAQLLAAAPKLLEAVLWSKAWADGTWKPTKKERRNHLTRCLGAIAAATGANAGGRQ